MVIPSPGSPEQETATARSVVYSLLARSFAYPSPSHLEALRHRLGPVVRGLVTGDGILDGLLADLLRSLEAPLAELRDAHGRSFTHIEPPDHPPYETAYCSADIFRQADTMADVNAFYRAHGLQVGGSERERPDHVATELDFMGMMAFKEAYALEHLGPEQVEECRRTQRHFLRDHLGCWAPGFGRRLAVSGEHELYRTVGAALARWVDADTAYVGVEPAAALSEPILPHEVDDGTCGGDAVCFDGGRGPTPVELSERRVR